MVVTGIESPSWTNPEFHLICSTIFPLHSFALHYMYAQHFADGVVFEYLVAGLVVVVTVWQTAWVQLLEVCKLKRNCRHSNSAKWIID